ncbi:dihydroxyacetone kinase subunit L [uncultured Anaerococcus sp.]|uniref:dihydroxyacetone kinase subunit L n=1 Tax=uncultured Anaerococcus sp. TaxID=293428 RepID=UPI00280BC1BF|nr:dihydroxyacetone kinase subunit L [uncultured Anaerococcus sp.]MDU5149579.1 dihydroxyacetone kinase subunit L [Anaerococcus prevotii]
MNTKDIFKINKTIEQLMIENKEYLIELDQLFGDGDLGISMCQGFKGLLENFNQDESDIGKVFIKMGRDFNESAPSSLGTILSFGMIGMAKATKGKENLSSEELYYAIKAGVDNIVSKTGSKEGEKTILDSLIPAVENTEGVKSEGIEKLAAAMAKEADKGAQGTKNMISQHGRAAYHGEKTLGHVDGGAYVGKLLFEALDKYYNK